MYNKRRPSNRSQHPRTATQVTRWLPVDDYFLSQYAGELNHSGYHTSIQLKPNNYNRAALFRSSRKNKNNNTLKRGKHYDERYE